MLVSFIADCGGAVEDTQEGTEAMMASAGRLGKRRRCLMHMAWMHLAADLTAWNDGSFLFHHVKSALRFSWRIDDDASLP